MKRPTLAVLLTTALFLAVSIPAVQAQQPPPPKEKKKPRKVWTEDDLAGLGGRINVVGTEAPPAPAEPPAAKAAQPGDALWKELDDLLEERQTIQVQIELNRQAVESLNQKLSEETDQTHIDELLQGRAWQEEEVATWEAELERVNARIAQLEKLTAGRKRPPKPPPAKTEKARPAPEGEEGEAKPAEKPPAEEEPPPPPPL